MIKLYFKFLYNYFFRRKKSYSQTGEDLILDFYLSDIKNGCYVDVGANDPVYMSNSYLFYRKGWSGICIEPDVNRCRMIQRVRRRDRVVNAAVGLKKEDLNFYVFEPDTISTLSVQEAERYQALGHKLVKQVLVPVKPLSSILEEFLMDRKIDVLSTDTEGFDLDVLKSNDWTKYRPKFIVVEAVEYHRDHSVRINKPLDEYLAIQGYMVFADTYINVIYIEKEYAKKRKFIE